MPRDFYAERGIVPNKVAKPTQRRDFYAERGITPSVRGSVQQQEPEEGFLSGLGSKFMSGVTGFNTAIERPIHGILQPLVENQYVPERLRNASRQVAVNREANYEREVERNPFSTLAGNVGGNVALYAPALMSGAGMGMSPYLAGALSGGAQAGAQYVNPGESRLENALYGGVTGATLPVVGKAIGGVTKGVKNVAKAYPVKKVAEKVISGMNTTKSNYNKMYSDIFKEASDLGVNEIKKPNINYNAIIKNNPGKFSKILKDFQETPTPELANKLQSDLGKRISSLQTKQGKSGLVSSEIHELERLSNAKDKLVKNLASAFEKKSPGLADRYRETSKGYAKEVIPYLKSAPIRRFRSGERGEVDFIKELTKDKTFMHKMGKLYPELRTREYLPKVASYLGKGSGILGTGALGSLGYNHFFGGHND